MSSGLFFPITGLFFSILLNVVYFTKKRIDNFENHLYKYMVITNLIALIFEFFCTYFSYNYHSILSPIVLKIYLLLLLSWITVLTIYMMYIARGKSYFKEMGIVFGILSVLVCFLPIHFTVASYGPSVYGASVNVIYFMSAFFGIVWLISVLTNISSLHNKKCIPIMIYCILGLTVAVIQYLTPGLLLITPMETFVTFLMYFTIENPDVKMIEQLNIVKSQAERANQAKSDFLSNMSHEIRTPLNAIVGFSQALQEENLPPQAQDEVKDIVMASETLLDIVNGILDISKIEANKLEIVSTEYSLQAVLDELVSLSKARLGEKPIEFRCVFDPSIPPYLYGDKVRVKQVVLNILTNAIKYTKQGFIEFKVSSIQKDGVCRLIISVEDSGIGIKPESINKLFTKFERLDIEKNNTIEGTGLGLAITKKLLELMGGQIVVQSVYGKGSKFTIALDQKIVTNPTTVVETKTVVATSKLDLTGKKILVVDDNMINLKVASRLLKDYNCLVDTANSGFDCIDKISNGASYDLILMDDMMPKMSGVETFHKLKENENFHIPTVALTANAISGMKEKYLQEGFQDYLAKPIEKTELYRVLVKFLQQK